jgi:addiction module HigA family antidote
MAQGKIGRAHPVHPGEVLREDYLKELGMSITQLAAELKIPTRRLSQIVHQKRAMTADTAMRVARYFGGDAQSWMGLQSHFELDTARLANEKKIKREVKPRAAA